MNITAHAIASQLFMTRVCTVSLFGKQDITIPHVTPPQKKNTSKTLLNWQKWLQWWYFRVTLNKPWTSVCLHSSCLLPLFIMFSNFSTFWSHDPGNLQSTADILSEGQITLGNTSEHSAMSQLHLPQWMIVLNFLLVFFLIESNMTVSLIDVRKLALNPSYWCLHNSVE